MDVSLVGLYRVWRWCGSAGSDSFHGGGQARVADRVGVLEVEGEGLKEGDAVVTIGAYGLPKETKVRVVKKTSL